MSARSNAIADAVNAELAAYASQRVDFYVVDATKITGPEVRVQAAGYEATAAGRAINWAERHLVQVWIARPIAADETQQEAIVAGNDLAEGVIDTLAGKAELAECFDLMEITRGEMFDEDELVSNRIFKTVVGFSYSYHVNL